MVALGSVLTVTLVGALRPVSANWAFFLAPGFKNNNRGAVRRGVEHDGGNLAGLDWSVSGQTRSNEKGCLLNYFS